MATPSVDRASGPPEAEIVELLLGSARNYLAQGQGEQALRCASRGLQLARDSEDAAGERDALTLLGRIESGLGRATDACATWSRCVELQLAAEDRLGAADTLCDLAEVQKREGRLDDARQTLQKSLRLSSHAEPGPLRVRALVELGHVRRLLGEPEAALRSFCEALRIAEATGERTAEARILNRLGNTYQKLGRLAEALDHQRRSLTIWEELENEPEMGKILNNIGTTLLEQGQSSASAQYFERARSLFEKEGDRSNLAHVLGNLGLLHDYRGEGLRAEPYLRESLAIREEIGDRPGQANCLNNLANVAHMMGRHDDAIGWARSSIAIRAELGQQEGLAKPWMNLALSLLELGRIPEAEEAARQVGALAERSGSVEILSEAHLLDAALALRRSDLQSAREAAERARILAERGGHRRQVAHALHLTGMTHLEEGDLDAAREALVASEGLCRDLQAHHLLALCSLTLGRLFLRAGVEEAGTERLRRAAETFERLGNLPLQWQSLAALAEAQGPSAGSQARATLAAAREIARRAGRSDLLAETETLMAELETGMQRGDRSTDASTLALFAKRLREAGSVPDASERALGLLADHLGAAFVAIWVVGPPERWYGPASQQSPIPEEVETLAADAVFSSASRSLRPPGGQSAAPPGPTFLAVPISGLSASPVGALVVGWRETDSAGPDPVPDPLPLLDACAAMLGLALQILDSGITEPAAAAAEPVFFEGLVGRSAPMQAIFRAIERVAPSDATVLVQGESGTGKELVARAIHRRSRRGGRPFVAISCPSIPRELIESELFGHEKGAFTGAHASRPGRIEMADGGTLFLDEIGDMASSTQTKLLRFLQEREFQRVGGRESIAVDVRLIAATSRKLEEEIEAGRFREDLYYRISVVPLRLPPLRHRVDDVRHLVEHFLREIATHQGLEVPAIAADAMEILRRYPWPGNVRELRNLVEYLLTMDPGRPITAGRIPARIREGAAEASSRRPQEGDSEEPLLRPGETLEAHLYATEGDLVRRALERCGWNQSHAARLLGITETRIRHRMKRYGIGRPGEKGSEPEQRKRRRTDRRRGSP